MSLNKQFTSGLRLRAIPAVLAGTALTMAALTPNAARAANECAPVGVSPADNGAAADTFACDGNFAGTGISYDSEGDLAINASGSLNVGTGGINLTANGGDDLSLAASGSISGTSGAIVEIQSSGATATPGLIDVNVASVSGTNANVTYAVDVAATNGASVNVVTGALQAVPNLRPGSASGQSALRVRATGGNGNVSIRTDGGVRGRLRGIEAQASGTGALNIVATGGVSALSSFGIGVVVPDDIVLTAIDARTDSGLLSINIAPGSGDINGGLGQAVLANAGGDAVINIASGRSVFAQNDSEVIPVMELHVAGQTTLTNNGVIARFGSGSLEQEIIQAKNNFAIRASGGSLLLNNNNVLSGRVDLGGLTGGATINNNASASWTLEGSGSFGSGVDVINNAGTMTVSLDSTYTGLDQLNNAGLILLGGANAGPAGDRLRIEGAMFNGTGNSRIALDVNYTGAQTDCSTAAVADCLDLSGGGSSGSTLLTVRNAIGGLGGGSSSNIVVIEGSSDASHFKLDPASDRYTLTANGPILRQQLFGYRLAYDEVARNHVLAAVPLDELFQPSTYAAVAQEIWRSTTGNWFERQADLRATPGGLAENGGIWVRTGGGSGNRDTQLVANQTVAGNTLSQLDYQLRTSYLLFGGDALGSVTQDGTWVLGATMGFVRADAEYKAPTSEVSYTGFTGGLYGSWVSGPLFVDVNLSANLLDVITHTPTLNLAESVNLTQSVDSLGVRAEGGWRFKAADIYWIEPLLSAAYVTTRRSGIGGLDGEEVFGFDEDAKSLRVGAGLRLAADLGLFGQTASYSITGRFWDEFEGENTNILLGSDPTTVLDDVSGGVTEVTASLGIYSKTGKVSGFLNVGGIFGKDYESLSGGFGLRVRW